MSKLSVIFRICSGNIKAMAIANGLHSQSIRAKPLNVCEANPSIAEAYDSFGFGHPAMGKAALKERGCGPFFTSIKTRIKGKRIALFGPYGWGDGRWMRNWQARMAADDAKLFEQRLTRPVGSSPIPKMKPSSGKRQNSMRRPRPPQTVDKPYFMLWGCMKGPWIHCSQLSH